MKQVFGRIFALLLTLSMIPGWALAQSAPTLIVGMVGTAQGKPVGGVKIVAKDFSGKVVREAATDIRGRYALPNLATGRYQLTLDPINSGFKGETVASAVGADGLTVNWTVSQMTAALAVATPGVSQPDAGLIPEATGGLIFLGGTGALLGLAAGLGAFNESKVASGSQ